MGALVAVSTVTFLIATVAVVVAVAVAVAVVAAGLAVVAVVFKLAVTVGSVGAAFAARENPARAADAAVSLRAGGFGFGWECVNEERARSTRKLRTSTPAQARRRQVRLMVPQQLLLAGCDLTALLSIVPEFHAQHAAAHLRESRPIAQRICFPCPDWYDIRHTHDDPPIEGRLIRRRLHAFSPVPQLGLNRGCEIPHDQHECVLGRRRLIVHTLQPSVVTQELGDSRGHA